MQNWTQVEGASVPLGATWIEEEQSFNFAIYSESATQVTLLFFTSSDMVTPSFRYEFAYRINKTGPVWHARLSRAAIGTAAYYAYSINGSASDSMGDWFRPNKLLLDPYATEVFRPATFDRSAALGTESNAGKALVAVLPPQETPFDWTGDQAARHSGDLIIYELHVRGFTMNPNSGVPVAHRGTYQGVVDKIPYLQQLGITAVELMPVFDFDETEPNYWGYMPLSFFAPHHEYSSAAAPGEPINEFKSMVKALHSAGIEVLLDVVYNHTGEGDEVGPTFNFKGIDWQTYYIPSGDPNAPFADFSGTGNTFNSAHRAARQIILDSLRYWVREMHVDGFRFDLASAFSRNADGSINFDDPPIFGDIVQDPELGNVRLIAEPWEGNPKYPNYELGEVRTKAHFPGVEWRQWNDQFRTAIRRFVKSDVKLVPEFMTRLYGSADLFPDTLQDACRPYQSLNYIDSHDGAPLYDLASYNSPESWNCGGPDGEQGLTDSVLRLRKRQVKNFCCLLLLSNGTPMFHAGDEFLRTQQGDTNPYNVDGPLTWVDWSRFDQHQDVFHFFSQMIAFRKNHASIARSTFWEEDVHWYGVTGGVDYGDESHAFAYCLKGGSAGDRDLYVMINTYWDALQFQIQEGQGWRRIVDTYLDDPQDFVSESNAPVLDGVSYQVQARSVVVLVSG